MKRLLVVGEYAYADPAVLKVARQVCPQVDYVHVNLWEHAVTADHVVVALGKKCIEAIINEKVKVDEVVGSVYEEPSPAGRVSVVAQYHPGYVYKLASEKGGFSEKVQKTWYDVWDSIQELISGQRDEIPDVTLVTEYDDLVERLNGLLSDTSLKRAYDYETWGDRDARRPELNREFYILTVGVALSDGRDAAAFAFPFEWRGTMERHWTPSQFKVIRSLWADVIEQGAAAHNAKYEHKCNILRLGKTGPLRDTYLMDNVLDELADHKLHRVAARQGVRWTRYKQQSDKIRKNPIDSALPDLLQYNGLDALATVLSENALQLQLDAENLDHIARMEEGFALELAWLEINGMAIDNAAAATVRAELMEEIPKLEEKFRELPEIKRVEAWASRNMKKYHRVKGNKPAVFSPKSPPMMKYLCIDVLKLPIKATIKRKGETVKETYKLDKRVLADHVESQPVLTQMMDLRSKSAMKTGFLDKWDQFVCPSLLVHSQYNQAKVVTGRLSSTDPPQQNIPKKSRVRKVFRSRYKGGQMVNADFVQQEPRLLAGWSGDRRLIEAIQSGLNLHAYAAALIFKQEYDGILDERGRLYDIGKRMNLGNMYGQTEYGLAAKTGMTSEDARLLLDMYDQQFDGAYKWRISKHREAMRYGYVTDLFGARRHLPDAKSGDKWRRARALRQAGNYPIQRTAFVFTLLSIREARRIIMAEGLDAEMCIACTVHDSLIGDAAPGYHVRLMEIMNYAMTDYHNESDYWRDSGVPMAVDFEVGANLYELVKVVDFSYAA